LGWGKFTVPVLASILILGIFGFSALDQQVYAESDGPPGSPTIQITKITTGGDGSFDFIIFNATNPADKQLVNIPDSFIKDSTTPLPVQAGSYSVIEDPVPNNWDLISSDCTINGIPHEFPPGSPSALNFNIQNGDTVVCTFENLFVPPPPEPTCTLPDVDNAPPAQCADVAVDEICQFACDAGFEPVPPTLTCQDDGDFDASPVCQAFVPPPEPTKVEVCHKNKKTLSINPDSVDDHMGHGDTLGPCEPEDKQKKVKEPKEEKQKKPKKSKK